jgi:hypothetical protein
MATALVVGDIVQCNVMCKTATQLGVNTWHWYIATIVSGAPTDADFAAACDSFFAGPYKAAMPPAARYTGVAVYILNRGLFPPASNADGVGVGLRDPELLPTQTCGIITKLTNTRGRAGRGRVYVPFPYTDAMDTDGSPTGAYLGRLDAIKAVGCSGMPFGDGVINSGVGSAALVHKDPDGISYKLITGGASRKKWAEQHKRGMYGQPNT